MEKFALILILIGVISVAAYLIRDEHKRRKALIERIKGRGAIYVAIELGKDK